MTRPGTQIIARDAAPPRTAPTDTGVWFAAGLAERGPAGTSVEVTSVDEFVATFGERQSYSYLYDAVQTFFREGGRRAVISRVVGDAAAQSTLEVDDASGTPVFVVKAASPGQYGNAITVAVTNGSGSDYTLSVVVPDEGTFTSATLDTQAEGLAFLAAVPGIVATAGASTNRPATLAATPLAGGSDDRATIDAANYTTALAAFNPELGPGQVSVPGVTDADVILALALHASTHNRRGLIDAEDTATTADLETNVATLRSDLGDLAEVVSLPFWPWVQVSGEAWGGVLRTVPPSAAVAGAIARSDSGSGNPNLPVAGENGRLQAVISLSQEAVSGEVREDLAAGAANVIREVYGEPRIYGFRTLAAKDEHPLHWQLANVRLDMAIQAKADEVAERYVHRIIDGEGITASQFGAELSSMLGGYHALGALYGLTPDEAFRVDVGDTVNTPQTIADGELRAVIAIRRSPMAELVVIEVVRTPVTQAV